MGYAECSESDFLLLVCDGISESNFPNADVVRMVATCLKENNDPGLAAKAVCQKAIESGSRDNVTCMLVLLTGSGQEPLQKSADFVPGPLSAASLEHKGFMTAYEGMAKRAGMTLAQAVELRYETVSEMLESRTITRAKTGELREELNAIGTPTGTKGSSVRSAWFRNWEEKLPESMTNDESETDLIRSLIAQRGLGLGLGGGSVGLPTAMGTTPIRRIRVPDVKTLQRVVNEHPELAWDPRMADVAGNEGDVMQDDPSDGTSQVQIRTSTSNVTAWLPTSALIRCDEGGSKGTRGGVSTPGNGVRRNHLPPTPPRLDQSMPLMADSSGRRPLPRPEVPSVVGGRGTSPHSSSSFRLSGSTITGAPRFPTMSATGGSGGRVTPPGTSGMTSPSGAGGFGRPPPLDSASGNRAQRAASVGVGGRATPPIGYPSSSGLGNRARDNAPAGRLSRSMPPHRQQ